MAPRTPKINDTVKFTDQQQAILNDAVEQLMEAGGLTENFKIGRAHV